jgi:hypothetical protein
MWMVAGPPVDLSDLYDRPLNAATLDTATDRIMDAITAQLEELRGDKAPAIRFDSRTAGVAEIGNPHRVHRKEAHPKKVQPKKVQPRKPSGRTNGEAS